MIYTIEYLDQLNQNYYAIVYNTGYQAYKTTTQLFTSYLDSSIDDYDLPLTQDANRTSRFTSTGVNVAALTKGEYTVEVWRRIGGTPSKNLDVLKGIQTMYWDGLAENPYMGVPKLSTDSFVGNGVLQHIHWMVNLHNQFGDLQDSNNLVNYTIYTTGAVLGTGFMTNLMTGLYWGTRNMTGQSNALFRQYDIFCYTNFEGMDISCLKTFYLSPSSVANNDSAQRMGYASGGILNIINPSSFITNLPIISDSGHNGSIMRMTTGSGIYQARIVSQSFAATTGKLNLHIPFIPGQGLASGDRFLIFPIGGEYGL